MPAPHCPHCAAPATCPGCAHCAAHCTCAPHPPAPAAALSAAARADLIQGHLPPGVTAFVELDAWVSIDTPDPTGRPTILEGDGVTGQAVATLWHVITSQAAELTTLRAQVGAGAGLHEVLEREASLANAMAQGHTMRERHKAMGRHHVIRAVRAALTGSGH